MHEDGGEISFHPNSTQELEIQENDRSKKKRKINEEYSENGSKICQNKNSKEYQEENVNQELNIKMEVEEKRTEKECIRKSEFERNIGNKNIEEELKKKEYVEKELVPKEEKDNRRKTAEATQKENYIVAEADSKKNIKKTENSKFNGKKIPEIVHGKEKEVTQERKEGNGSEDIVEKEEVEEENREKVKRIGPNPIYVNPRRPPDEFKVWLKVPEENLKIRVSEEDKRQDEEIEKCEIPLGAGKANLPGWRDKLFGEGEKFKEAKEDFKAPEELTKQKGIYFSVKESEDPFKHMEETINRFLKVKKEEPGEGLDEDLIAAAVFHATKTPDQIVQRLEDFKKEWKKWKKEQKYEEKVKEIREKFKAPLQVDPFIFRDALQRMGVGGEQFCKRLREGMPLTGVYDEPGIWARRRGRNKKKPINVSTIEEYLRLQKSLLNDIKKIAKTQTSEENQRAWTMLDKDFQDGFYEGPYKVSEVPEELKNFLPARFFVTTSGGKDRAIINAARSRLNDFTEVRTPISLDGPSQVISTAKLINKINPKINLHTIKKDQSDAYKSLNLHRSQKKFACIGLIIPPGTNDKFEVGELALYFSKTLFFGAESAVVLYNTLSRSLVAIMRRLLGLPTLAYFDDFLILVRKELVEPVRKLISEIFELFQIKIRVEKDEFGEKVTWLGVSYSWEEESKLKLDISKSRKKNILDALKEIIKTRRVSKDELHKLIGRLESVQQIQGGRVGRPYIFPLYTKLYAAHFNEKISERAIRALKWWKEVIEKEDLGVTIELQEEELERIIIYTDATLQRKGFVACRESKKQKKLEIQEGGWNCIQEGKPITFYELQAAVEILEQIPLKGPNCAIFLFIDNIGAQAILQRGWSPDNNELSQLAERAWRVLAAKKLKIWIERVPSLANPSDYNSREEGKREWFWLWGEPYRSEEFF